MNLLVEKAYGEKAERKFDKEIHLFPNRLIVLKVSSISLNLGYINLLKFDGSSVLKTTAFNF